MITRSAYRTEPSAALLMTKARAHLDAGDLSRASEKGWEAAAQVLDAVAERRGWEHAWHGDYYRTVGRLTDELGDKRLSRLFLSVSELEQNIHEDWWPEGFVASSLNDVEELARRLDDALGCARLSVRFERERYDRAAMTERSDYHAETAAAFLSKARVYLDEGDLLQASEKGWGAAAQMTKAVAEERGWRHNSHVGIQRAVDSLADDLADEQLQDLFYSASTLHRNFYEGWMDEEMVADALADVDEFTRRLSGCLERG